MDKPNKTDLRIEHTIDTPVRFLMRQVRRRVTLLQPILGFIGTGSYRNSRSSSLSLGEQAFNSPRPGRRYRHFAPDRL
jgi:hypothetical protein